MRDQTYLHGLTEVLYSPGNAVSKELHCSIITITFPWEPLSKKGSLPVVEQKMTNLRFYCSVLTTSVR